MVKKYSSNNPRLSDKEAKIIGRFIDEKFKGSVTAKEFLDAARPKSSPIHGLFDWDDSSAAEKFRLHQAKSFIISVYIEADDHKPIREFMSVKVGQHKHYVGVDQVEQSQDLIDQVIAEAKLHLVRWQERYGRYVEYFNFKFVAKGKEHGIEKEGNPGRKAVDDTWSKKGDVNTNVKRSKSAISKQVFGKGKNPNFGQTRRQSQTEKRV